MQTTPQIASVFKASITVNANNHTAFRQLVFFPSLFRSLQTTGSKSRIDPGRKSLHAIARAPALTRPRHPTPELLH